MLKPEFRSIIPLSLSQCTSCGLNNAFGWCILSATAFISQLSWSISSCPLTDARATWGGSAPGNRCTWQRTPLELAVRSCGTKMSPWSKSRWHVDATPRGTPVALRFVVTATALRTVVRAFRSGSGFLAVFALVGSRRRTHARTYARTHSGASRRACFATAADSCA